MSTHTYNLRSAGRTAQASGGTIPGAFQASVNNANSSVEVEDDLTELSMATADLHLGDRPGSPSETVGASRVRPGVSYSQAASPRSSSPQPLVDAVEKVDEVPLVPLSRPFAATVEDVPDESEVAPPRESTDDGLWTTVRHRRARSSGSSSADVPSRGRTLGKSILTPEQHAVVQAAEGQMGPADRLQVERRRVVIHAESQRDRSLSRGEGSSRRQGKTIDPRNWGNSGIPDEELDPSAQRRELESYAARNELVEEYDADEQRRALAFWKAFKEHEATQRSEGGPSAPSADGDVIVSTRHPRVDDGDTLRVQNAQLAEQNRVLMERLTSLEASVARSLPNSPVPVDSRGNSLVPFARVSLQREVSQAAESFVDAALKQSNTEINEISKKKKTSKGAVREHPLPASQIEPHSYLGMALGAGGEPGDDSSDSSSESDLGHNRRNHAPPRGHNTRATNMIAVSAPSHAPVLKPREPEPYKGTVDIQVFYKFISEMQEYCEGYGVEQHHIASTVSHFLEGRAYEFYTTTVSKN